MSEAGIGRSPDSGTEATNKNPTLVIVTKQIVAHDDLICVVACVFTANLNAEIALVNVIPLNDRQRATIDIDAASGTCAASCCEAATIRRIVCAIDVMDFVLGNQAIAGEV